MVHRWPLETQNCGPQVAIRVSRLWSTGWPLEAQDCSPDRWPLEAQDCIPQMTY